MKPGEFPMYFAHDCRGLFWYFIRLLPFFTTIFNRLSIDSIVLFICSTGTDSKVFLTQNILRIFFKVFKSYIYFYWEILHVFLFLHSETHFQRGSSQDSVLYWSFWLPFCKWHYSSFCCFVMDHKWGVARVPQVYHSSY